MELSYFIEKDDKKYVRQIVNKNAITAAKSADTIQLPYKEIDVDKDKRWNAKKINAEMMQAIERGESIKEMSERLHRVSNMNKASAIRNAQTMTTAFESQGRFDAMKKMRDDGTILKKQWLSLHDKKTRDAHLQLDKVVVDIDEPFVNDIGPIMYPADPAADAANVYNCRCTLTTVVEGFDFKSTLPKGTIKVSGNELSTSREADIIARQTVLKEKIQEYSEFANPNLADIYDKIKAQKYYEYRKEYYKLQDELNNIRKAERKTRLHINQIVTEKAENKKEGRYITSGTYERAEKRLEKAILRNMGE